jgi:GNAT superfamily N-acetyltransferase
MDPQRRPAAPARPAGAAGSSEERDGVTGWNRGDAGVTGAPATEPGAAEPAAELAEATALADLFAAVAPDVAARHGVVWTRFGPVLCTAVGALPSVSVLNRLAGLELAGPATAEHLDAACAWFAERHCDAHAAVVPFGRHDRVEALLAQRGFEPGYSWMRFLRSPLPAPAWPDRVRRAGAGEALAFGEVVASGFGMPSFAAEWLSRIVGRPGWRAYLAVEGGGVAGAAASFTLGGVAWLGFGAVLPAYRGKGAQSALLAARIADAAADGCTLVTTETGVREEGRPSFSYANILRAGFREAYVRPNHVLRRSR